MATAYASLVSLMNVLTRNSHPTFPISLQTIPQVQSLLSKLTFLADFLEKYSLTEDSEQEITKTAFAAEDLIESYLVDQILTKSDVGHAKFHQDLEKSNQEMDFIIQKVKRKNLEINQQKNGTLSVNVSGKKSNKMVGFDQELVLLMDKLTMDKSSIEIVPIVGMGGIGKTTLARNVYDHPYVRNHFYIRAWSTVSQEYDVERIIRDVLNNIRVDGRVDEKSGGGLHRVLFGRKYLVVLDDVWSSVVWDEIRRFFPENNNGSRILLTTRIMSVAVSVGSCSPFEMKLLDDDKSLCLLAETAFGESICRPELEKFGEEIAKGCKGLPLAIIVIGGLLKVSQKTPEFWAYVAKNVRSILDVENDEHCLKILSLSYNHLPVQLKPCFLYIATIQEDEKICVSELIRLWIADGFLRPVLDRSLEEVALQYLNDLIDRHLIMVQKRGSSGEPKKCIVHDLLWEFCSREARRGEGFVCHIQGFKHPRWHKLLQERRLIHHADIILHYPSSAYLPLARSFSSNFWPTPKIAYSCRLLRVLRIRSFANEFMHHVNLRYLKCEAGKGTMLFSSLSLFWNIETLIVYHVPEKTNLPSEIWEFPNLRHLEFYGNVILPDPRGDQTYLVLDSLQTLCGIENFNFSDEVVSRVPNLKTLRIEYDMEDVSNKPKLFHYFTNMARLRKLETLSCCLMCCPTNGLHVIKVIEILNSLSSLKKLTLSRSNIPWENMTVIGSMQNLEVLKLKHDAFRGAKWNSNEGEFHCLKYLYIYLCDLEIWNAESSHFPRLERLVLILKKLKEIPLEIAEVTSLQSIELRTFEKSVVIAAKEILDERQNQGDNDFFVEGVYFSHTEEEKTGMEELVNDNFRMEFEVYEESDEEEDED